MSCSRRQPRTKEFIACLRPGEHLLRDVSPVVSSGWRLVGRSRPVLRRRTAPFFFLVGVGEWWLDARRSRWRLRPLRSSGAASTFLAALSSPRRRRHRRGGRFVVAAVGRGSGGRATAGCERRSLVPARFFSSSVSRSRPTSRRRWERARLSQHPPGRRRRRRRRRRRHRGGARRLLLGVLRRRRRHRGGAAVVFSVGATVHRAGGPSSARRRPTPTPPPSRRRPSSSPRPRSSRLPRSSRPSRSRSTPTTSRERASLVPAPPRPPPSPPPRPPPRPRPPRRPPSPSRSARGASARRLGRLASRPRPRLRPRAASADPSPSPVVVIVVVTPSRGVWSVIVAHGPWSSRLRPLSSSWARLQAFARWASEPQFRHRPSSAPAGAERGWDASVGALLGGRRRRSRRGGRRRPPWPGPTPRSTARAPSSLASSAAVSSAFLASDRHRRSSSRTSPPASACVLGRPFVALPRPPPRRASSRTSPSASSSAASSSSVASSSSHGVLAFPAAASSSSSLLRPSRPRWTALLDADPLAAVVRRPSPSSDVGPAAAHRDGVDLAVVLVVVGARLVVSGAALSNLIRSRIQELKSNTCSRVRCVS